MLKYISITVICLRYFQPCYFKSWIQIKNDNTIFYREKESCMSIVHDFMESLVSNVWSLPSTSKRLIEESVSFIKMVIVRRFMNENIEFALNNSILKILGMYPLLKMTM